VTRTFHDDELWRLQTVCPTGGCQGTTAISQQHGEPGCPEPRSTPRLTEAVGQVRLEVGEVSIAACGMAELTNMPERRLQQSEKDQIAGGSSTTKTRVGKCISAGRFFTHSPMSLRTRNISAIPHGFTTVTNEFESASIASFRIRSWHAKVIQA